MAALAPELAPDPAGPPGKVGLWRPETARKSDVSALTGRGGTLTSDFRDRPDMTGDDSKDKARRFLPSRRKTAP